MKNCFFLIIASFLLALSGVAVAQEATPEPTASPAASSPEPAISPEPTPESTSPTPQPSPASLTPEETAPADAPPEPSLDASAAQASPAPAESASGPDILPEPADSSLGAIPPPPPPLESLPSEAVSADELPNPDSLIPPDDLSPESGPPPAPKIVENKFQQERKLKVRYQEVKLQALKDANVRSLSEQADKAKTDEDKRQALREYYRLLFARMVAIDPNLAEKCNEMQRAYFRRLGQYRVEPTIPLNPPPTPEPLEIAGASSTPPNAAH